MPPRFEAVLLALAVPILLRTAGLDGTRRLIAPRRVRPRPVVEVLRSAAVLDRRPVRWALRPRCLSRSLVLWRLLRAAGHEADLVIGFRRGEAVGTGRGPLLGHAWVEVGGRPLPDAENLAAYAEVARLGGAPRAPSTGGDPAVSLDTIP